MPLLLLCNLVPFAHFGIGVPIQVAWTGVDEVGLSAVSFELSTGLGLLFLCYRTHRSAHGHALRVQSVKRFCRLIRHTVQVSTRICIPAQATGMRNDGTSCHNMWQDFFLSRCQPIRQTPTRLSGMLRDVRRKLVRAGGTAVRAQKIRQRAAVNGFLKSRAQSGVRQNMLIEFFCVHTSILLNSAKTASVFCTDMVLISATEQICAAESGKAADYEKICPRKDWCRLKTTFAGVVGSPYAIFRSCASIASRSATCAALSGILPSIRPSASSSGCAP